MTQALTVQSYLKDANVQTRIAELLKDRAGQFTTSLLSAVNANEKLSLCKPETVMNAALTAASLDLPINPNLGFAYIIPYKDEAQFQMGYKGFIQLAQRSGQYKTIASTTVYEGQLVSEDPLKGNVYDWKAKTSDTVLGYVALFELMNGFEKTMYMTAAEMTKHGKKFSQTFKKGFGMWVDDFESMALKTVLKLLISKFGPMNTTMQKAIQYDQAVVKDAEVVYADNDALEHVGADDDKKDAIVAAHTTEAETTLEDKPKAEEAKDDTDAPGSTGKS